MSQMTSNHILSKINNYCESHLKTYKNKLTNKNKADKIVEVVA